jgi:heme-degrading monooxygenase HmoA/ribosomal protein S18 acetylase RimI-like enzyme
VTIDIRVHDDLPEAECAVVDRGIGEANDAAAPLHEVRPLSCFAHDAARAVVGGAVGRRWGRCCELQQLWVRPDMQRQGLGTRLVEAFEARAGEHGCTEFYLDTFNFQAPDFYRRLGYRVAHDHAVYPHDIHGYLMVKSLAADAAAISAPAPAATPAPPYYAVIFTSVRAAGDNGYGEAADRILDLARQQPGFLGFESARQGLGVSVSYWSSLEAIAAWRDQADHRLVRSRARDWYAAFRVRICRVERDYGN